MNKTDLARIWRGTNGSNRWPNEVDAFINAVLLAENDKLRELECSADPENMDFRLEKLLAQCSEAISDLSTTYYSGTKGVYDDLNKAVKHLVSLNVIINKELLI